MRSFEIKEGPLRSGPKPEKIADTLGNQLPAPQDPGQIILSYYAKVQLLLAKSRWSILPVYLTAFVAIAKQSSVVVVIVATYIVDQSALKNHAKNLIKHPKNATKIPTAEDLTMLSGREVIEKAKK